MLHDISFLRNTVARNIVSRVTLPQNLGYKIICKITKYQDTKLIVKIITGLQAVTWKNVVGHFSETYRANIEKSSKIEEVIGRELQL